MDWPRLGLPATAQLSSPIPHPSRVLEPEQSELQRNQLLAELENLGSPEAAAVWAQRALAAKNGLIASDARRIEEAFQTKLAAFGEPKAAEAKASSLPPPSDRLPARSTRATQPRKAAIDKAELPFPEPRRIRDKAHVKFVAKQPCLICGRQPSDAHHLRFAQHPALGRKVSDEFTVPLCRGHHREVHRSGDEAAWWNKAGIDPMLRARTLWLKTHPLPTRPDRTSIDDGTSGSSVDIDRKKAGHERRTSKRGTNYETKPILPADPHDSL